MDVNYPSNSKGMGAGRTVPDESPKQVHRVVTGEVIRRKTPLGRRLAKNLSGDESQSVWGFVFGDIIVPAMQNMAYEAVVGSAERTLFRGQSARILGGRGLRSHIPYNQYSMASNKVGRQNEPRQISRRGRANHSFDEIVISSRAEAMEILNQMQVMAEKYDGVSVSDFYEMCGVSGQWTDQKWGWTHMEGANIQRLRGGGYILNLPRPELLET